MGQGEPFFSIIIPTYARLERLAICLGALARLEYPRDRFEVIVVDDGSDRSPESVISNFRDRFNIILLKQSHAGPATARNAGARKAKGDLLAFTDDDCEPASDWLRALANRFGSESNC